MKRENTEQRHARQKREAVRGVLAFMLIQLLCAACFGALCLIPNIPARLQVCFLVMAALCLIAILPAVWVLRIRFKEIEGGELDAAGQY